MVTKLKDNKQSKKKSNDSLTKNKGSVESPQSSNDSGNTINESGDEHLLDDNDSIEPIELVVNELKIKNSKTNFYIKLLVVCILLAIIAVFITAFIILVDYSNITAQTDPQTSEDADIVPKILPIIPIIPIIPTKNCAPPFILLKGVC